MTNANSPSDVALQAPPIIDNPGKEYSSASRQWQGIPGIECASNGRLWATWYSGGAGEGPDNYVLLVNSDDGQSWSEPLLVVAPRGKVRAFDPVVWIDPAQRLWLFWAQSLESYDGRAGVWAIRKEDATQSTLSWTEPRRLCDGIMMNKPTVLSSGEWCLPVTLWGHTVKKYSVFPEEEQVPHVVVSSDRGESFLRRGAVQMENRSCDEQMIIERRDSSLWMLTRRKDGIGESTSRDKGHTWTKGRKSELTHPSENDDPQGALRVFSSGDSNREVCCW